MQSKYCYKGTDVLINNFNIKDQNILNKVEADLTHINIVKLEKNPIMGKFDLKHLQKIHYEIFKDIYPFAGKIREENISKGNFTFAYAQYIDSAAMDLFKQLKNDKLLKGLPYDKFCEKTAYYMSEINVLHPFREGNGRTQREFIRSLALNCGYKLDWSKISKEDMLRASISSVINTKDLEKLIGSAIDNKIPSKDLIKMFSLDFDLNR